MIDPKRAELLKLLAEISEAYPDMRMGQLIPAAREQRQSILDRNSQVA